jgi:hypothetical protein
MPRFRMNMTIRRFASFALPALTLMACDSPTDVAGPRPPAQKPVAYVEIIAPPGELMPGQTLLLGTRLLDAEGALLNRPVAWTSSDTAIAQVSAAGVLTAKAAGVVQVTARAEQVEASLSVSVRPASAITTIEIDAPQAGLLIGQTFTLGIRIRDQDGVLLYRPVAWTSSDQAIAVVSDAGVVTARAIGQALITATVEGRSQAVAITVQSDPAIATALEPAAIRAGSPGFELKVRGTGFEPGARVRWAGQERQARVISPTEIRIDIAAGDVQHPGGAEVQVLNPGQTLGARLYFIIEKEPVTHTWDLAGLAWGGDLPVEIGSFFQGGDLTKMVDQRVTRGVLRISEPAYGPSRWELTVRVVTTLRSTGAVVKDEDVLFFGTVEYTGLEGYMYLRSDLFPAIRLRTAPAPNGDLIVWQTLHHTGDAQHEQAWRYTQR